MIRAVKKAQSISRTWLPNNLQALTQAAGWQATTNSIISVNEKCGAVGDRRRLEQSWGLRRRRGSRRRMVKNLWKSTLSRRTTTMKLSSTRAKALGIRSKTIRPANRRNSRVKQLSRNIHHPFPLSTFSSNRPTILKSASSCSRRIQDSPMQPPQVSYNRRSRCKRSLKSTMTISRAIAKKHLCRN